MKKPKLFTRPAHPTYAVELVSPADAARYLTHNHGNRPLRPGQVDLYAREITDGRWRINGEDLIFADSGRLMSGQHRLNAIIKANKAIEIGVKRGVPEDAFNTLDQGMKRTSGDDLHALGLAYPHRCGAAARLILTWQSSRSVNSPVSKTEIYDFAAANRDIADSMACSWPAGKLGMSPAALGAVHWLATRDPEKRDLFADFLKGLFTGVGLPEGSPLLALRTTALAQRRGASFPTAVWFSFIAQTWNDFAAGRSRKALRSMAWPKKITGHSYVRVEPTPEFEGSDPVQDLIAQGSTETPTAPATADKVVEPA